MSLLALSAFGIGLMGQTVEDFGDGSDILSKSLKERTTIASHIRLREVTVNDKVKKNQKKKLDLNFGEGVSDFPWSEADVEWFRGEVVKLFPEQWKDYQLGEIFCGKSNIKELIGGSLNNDGTAQDFQYSVKDPFAKVLPVVRRLDDPEYQKGLSGRHISLWQSHGRYYEIDTDRWEWQRAPLHRTVEDMYTQSYVIPFLIPMLENAGAYVLTPRERDTQIYESVCDNDPAFVGKRAKLVRTCGEYFEEGSWNNAGEGFADGKEIYKLEENPFTMGSARMVPAIRKAGAGEARAIWKADLPEDGEYSVYVSYKTVANSTNSAHYTVHHKGGDSEFIVNQQIGGSTWIYLGSFNFKRGEASVTLDNICPEGRKFVKKSVVTADAVKFGGGMGKIARGADTLKTENFVTSGLPAFTEGAMYWMQWAGVTPDIWNHFEDDYTNDYASRGAWTEWMLKQKGVPFDLSMAFHTDAGTTMDDRIIGSLSVYTLMANDSRTTVMGIDRMSCRRLADLIQQQICNDVRQDFEPSWNKRMLWDRSYSESRVTGVPGMLLELLSHQNLADMKYGLDPTFRFTVSRAIYKGMLKTISDMYGVPYTVQPLPVHSFSAILTSTSEVRLSWKATEDRNEPTATPDSYIIQTRVDDGEFDKGISIQGTEITMPVEAGHIYSYRIVAVNEGGKSFPSEILSAGVPTGGCGKTILVVNNFDRVSAPAWYDTPQYAGFDGKLDGGVPYIKEINYIGENYENRRDFPWKDDDNPGFGASHSEYAGKLLAGNTFDFTAIHGEAFKKLGYAFCSASSEAFANGECGDGFWTIDLLCGKQVTTKIGRGAVQNRYQVFPEALRNRISESACNGANLIVSGANIATDVWDQVYPIEIDEEYRKAGKEFCQSVLGYKWLTGRACYTGKVASVISGEHRIEALAEGAEFFNTANAERYCVENPDGLRPADENGYIFLNYTGNEIPAAIMYNAPKGYKVASFGFPLESVKDSGKLGIILENTLKSFNE